VGKPSAFERILPERRAASRDRVRRVRGRRVRTESQHQHRHQPAWGTGGKASDRAAWPACQMPGTHTHAVTWVRDTEYGRRVGVSASVRSVSPGAARGEKLACEVPWWWICWRKRHATFLIEACRRYREVKPPAGSAEASGSGDPRFGAPLTRHCILQRPRYEGRGEGEIGSGISPLRTNNAEGGTTATARARLWLRSALGRRRQMGHGDRVGGRAVARWVRSRPAAVQDLRGRVGGAHHRPPWLQAQDGRVEVTTTSTVCVWAAESRSRTGRLDGPQRSAFGDASETSPPPSPSLPLAHGRWARRGGQEGKTVRRSLSPFLHRAPPHLSPLQHHAPCTIHHPPSITLLADATLPFRQATRPWAV
jgi:hypothetical protein